MHRAMPIRLGCLLLGLVGGCQEAPPSRARPVKDPPQTMVSEKQPPLAGVLSCSGRGCHADFVRPEEKDQPIYSTSYTRWLHHDPHTRAYQVLFEPLAQEMGRKLGVDVTNEPRCLVCHCTPLAARNEESAKQERNFGVGCEACHGPARDWLTPHRAADWNKRSGQEKQDKFGLVNLGSQAVRAGVCAGCHVGAPADPEHGLPARDMNHDFIAAGHPRLMFEYSAFLANEPKHWKEKDTRSDFEVRAWLVGQAATGKATLDLLADRAAASANHHGASPADTRPWPEFSSYDCYACHHPLEDPAWRQSRGYKGRPGSLPLSEWSLTLLPLVSRAAGKSDGSHAGWVELARTMGRPMPPRDPVRRQAEALARPLPVLAAALEQKTYDKAAIARLRSELLEQYRKMKQPDWDAVEQMALGLQALETADRDEEREKVVQQILKKLSFGPDQNSPLGFRQQKTFDAELDSLFIKLGK